jgi:hypothetical protein
MIAPPVCLPPFPPALFARTATISLVCCGLRQGQGRGCESETAACHALPLALFLLPRYCNRTSLQAASCSERLNGLMRAFLSWRRWGFGTTASVNRVLQVGPVGSSLKKKATIGVSTCRATEALENLAALSGAATMGVRLHEPMSSFRCVNVLAGLGTESPR